MLKLKNKNGVTLIALVVTIIVLLILAVVSFRIITGDDGIMKKAETAASETEKVRAKEQVEMFFSKKVADYYEAYCSIFPTGVFSGPTVASTAKKNIYDVAGNVWEWTTEQPVNASTTSDPHAVFRGGGTGSYGSVGLATYRGGDYSAMVFANWNIGARLVLYVQ